MHGQDDMHSCPLSAVAYGNWEHCPLLAVAYGNWEHCPLLAVAYGNWEHCPLLAVAYGNWKHCPLLAVACGNWEHCPLCMGIGNIVHCVWELGTLFVFPSLREAERRAKTIMTSPSLPPDVAAQKLLPTISSNQVSRQQRQAGSGHLPAISHQPSRQHRAPGQLHRNKNKHIKNQVRTYVPCALVQVVVILGDSVCSNTTSILAVAMP